MTTTYNRVQPKNHTAAFFFFLINALIANIINIKGSPTIISSGIKTIDPGLNCNICIANSMVTIDVYKKYQILYPRLRYKIQNFDWLVDGAFYEKHGYQTAMVVW